MEKTDKPLTRDALVSMQVIDAKGRLIGKVKDVAFAVGKTGIALSVENEAGEIATHLLGRCSSSIRLHTSKAQFHKAPINSSNNPFKLKVRNSQLNRFAQHAINLSHGFHNTKDGTATTTRNTFKQQNIFKHFKFLILCRFIWQGIFQYCDCSVFSKTQLLFSLKHSHVRILHFYTVTY